MGGPWKMLGFVYVLVIPIFGEIVLIYLTKTVNFIKSFLDKSQHSLGPIIATETCKMAIEPEFLSLSKTLKV